MAGRTTRQAETTPAKTDQTAAATADKATPTRKRATAARATPAASTPAASTPAASTPAASTPAASTPVASTPASSTSARPTPTMSEAHKQALSTGREEGRVVRRYLEALESSRSAPARRRDPEAIEMRLAQIGAHLSRADPVSRVLMIQERMNLEHELALPDPAGDLPALEEAFVRAAGPYARRRKVSWTAWREAGVPAGVLRRAGIPRGALT